MTEDEILTNLCTRDPRNPNHKDIYAYLEDDKDEIPPVPRVGCYCDSCFKGCDSFAVELLKTREVLKATWYFIENVTQEDPERNDKFFELRGEVKSIFHE